MKIHRRNRSIDARAMTIRAKHPASVATFRALDQPAEILDAKAARADEIVVAGLGNAGQHPLAVRPQFGPGRVDPGDRVVDLRLGAG